MKRRNPTQVAEKAQRILARLRAWTLLTPMMLGSAQAALPGAPLNLVQELGNGLSLPTDVAVGRDGRVYVVDSAHHRIVVYAKSGKRIKHFADEGTGKAQLKGPVGIGTGPKGRVYVADRGNHRIQVFDAEGGFIISIALKRGRYAIRPVDVAVNAQGTLLYITGNNNHRVMVYTTAGRFVREWGGEGVNRGEFRFPATVALGKDDAVHVVDVLNTRVQKFDSQGELRVQIGEWGVQPGQFFRPKGVAVDNAGRVYVSDSYLQVVQVFDERSRFLYVLGENNAPKRFEAPVGLAVAGGRLYVTDQLAGKVLVFTVGHPP